MRFLLALVIIVVGWLAGALVNYLADVLPHRRRLTRPFCPACERDQGWWNYLVWPRRCPHCGAQRPWRAWGVEILTIGAVFFFWYQPPERLNFGAWLVLWVYFAVVVVIDFEHHLILHPVSLTGSVIGAAVGIWLHGWRSTLIGGLAGFVIMFGLYWFGRLVVRGLARMRGQTLDLAAGEDEGMGFGDVMLSGVLGLILGWPGIVAGLMVAFVFGGIVSLIYIAVMLLGRRYRAFQAIPYGPFLIAGALLLLLTA